MFNVSRMKVDIPLKTERSKFNLINILLYGILSKNETTATGTAEQL